MPTSASPSLLAHWPRWLVRSLLAVILVLTVFAPTTTSAAGVPVDIYVGAPPAAFPCTNDGMHNAMDTARSVLASGDFPKVHVRCANITITAELEDLAAGFSIKIIGETPAEFLSAPAATRATLDAQGLSRVFAITPTATLILENLNITNGNVVSGFGSGGDINNAGNLQLINSEVSHGAAAYGGGIYNAPGAHLTLIDSVVDFNHGTLIGGGLYADAGSQTSLQTAGPVNATCICNNTSVNDGAGIFNHGSLSIAAGTLFQNNVTGSFGGGGALENLGGQVTLAAQPSSRPANAAPAGLAIPDLANSVIAPTRFISNSAGTGGGGAIYNSGSLTLTNVALLSNTTTYRGGGIESITGTLQLANAYVAYNKASGGGGGIENDWNMTASALSVFSNTSPAQAGGLDLYHGTSVISGSTFISNSSQTGGGILVNSGRLQLDQSTVADNLASIGGAGLYQGSAATTDVANSTFSGNISTGIGGGGLYNLGTLTMTSSTIVSNSTTSGAGNLHNAGGGAWLHNSIVAFGAPINCSGAITSTGYNLESANTCNVHATGDHPNTAPNIGPLADNGGVLAGAGVSGLPYDGQAPWTHALITPTVAIDGGDQANCPATDERGALRPLNGCDIGAFEFGARVPQTIAFTLPVLLTLNQSPYPLGGSATSGLVVTYTVSGAPCSLAGSNLLLSSTGPCSVTAHQAGNGNYNPALDVSQPITVGLALFLPLLMR